MDPKEYALQVCNRKKVILIKVRLEQYLKITINALNAIVPEYNFSIFLQVRFEYALVQYGTFEYDMVRYGSVRIR